MKLLYGTTNEGKLLSMSRALEALDIELMGVEELKCEIPFVEETGTTPLENARLKAKAYYKAFQMPVFSCDSGLYFETVPSQFQPGVHARRPLGYTMTDQQMMEYYSGLARRFNGPKACYRNAVCFYMDENHVYESEEQELSGEPFILATKPHERYQRGFPLDRFSIQISSGKYYYELPNDAQDVLAADQGFLKFFQKILK